MCKSPPIHLGTFPDSEVRAVLVFFSLAKPLCGVLIPCPPQRLSPRTTVNWRHDLGVPVGSHLTRASSGSPRGDGGQQRGGRKVRVSVPQTRPCPGAHLQVAVLLYRGGSSLGDCVSSRSFSWLGDSALCARAPQVLRRSVQLSPIRVSRRSTHPQRTTLWLWLPLSTGLSPSSAKPPCGGPATSAVQPSVHFLGHFFRGSLAALPVKLACLLALTPYRERRDSPGGSDVTESCL